jgi:hypothetical protein
MPIVTSLSTAMGIPMVLLELLWPSILLASHLHEVINYSLIYLYVLMVLSSCLLYVLLYNQEMMVILSLCCWMYDPYLNYVCLPSLFYCHVPLLKCLAFGKLFTFHMYEASCFEVQNI